MPRQVITDNPLYTKILILIKKGLATASMIYENYNAKNEGIKEHEMRRKILNIAGRPIGADRKKYPFLKCVKKLKKEKIYDFDYEGIIKFLFNHYLVEFISPEDSVDALDMNCPTLATSLSNFLKEIPDKPVADLDSLDIIFESFIVGRAIMLPEVTHGKMEDTTKLHRTQLVFDVASMKYLLQKYPYADTAIKWTSISIFLNQTPVLDETHLVK